MIITKELEWDMGHRVPNHKSKCSNPHGHRYRAEVGVSGTPITRKGDSSEGMVIDFGDLKKIMVEQIEDKLDHGYMIYEGDEFLPLFEQIRDKGKKVIMVPFIPTAENIAKYLFEKLDPVLANHGIGIRYVRIWETPTSTAIWGSM